MGLLDRYYSNLPAPIRALPEPIRIALGLTPVGLSSVARMAMTGDEEVAKALTGAGFAATGKLDQLGINPWSSPNPTTREVAARALAAFEAGDGSLFARARAANEEAARGHEFETFVLNQLTDPLNYLGVGEAALAAKLPRAAEVLRVTNAAQNIPSDLAFQGVGKVAQIAGRKVRRSLLARAIRQAGGLDQIDDPLLLVNAARSGLPDALTRLRAYIESPGEAGNVPVGNLARLGEDRGLGPPAPPPPPPPPVTLPNLSETPPLAPLVAAASGTPSRARSATGLSMPSLTLPTTLRQPLKRAALGAVGGGAAGYFAGLETTTPYDAYGNPLSPEDQARHRLTMAGIGALAGATGGAINGRAATRTAATAGDTTLTRALDAQRDALGALLEQADSVDVNLGISPFRGNNPATVDAVAPDVVRYLEQYLRRDPDTGALLPTRIHKATAQFPETRTGFDPVRFRQEAVANIPGQLYSRFAAAGWRRIKNGQITPDEVLASVIPTRLSILRGGIRPGTVADKVAANYPDLLPEMFASLVRGGEDSGKLRPEDIAAYLVIHTDEGQRLARAIKGGNQDEILAAIEGFRTVWPSSIMKGDKQTLLDVGGRLGEIADYINERGVQKGTTPAELINDLAKPGGLGIPKIAGFGDGKVPFFFTHLGAPGATFDSNVRNLLAPGADGNDYRNFLRQLYPDDLIPGIDDAMRHHLFWDSLKSDRAGIGGTTGHQGIRQAMDYTRSGGVLGEPYNPSILTRLPRALQPAADDAAAGGGLTAGMDLASAAATALKRRGPSVPAKLIGPSLAGRDVLDYGAGHGADVVYYNGLGARADGYDPYNGTWRTLPDRLYDVVTSSYVLNTIADPAERRQAVREIASRLRPGGEAVIAVRSAREVDGQGGTRYLDGWVTRGKRTFQKGYTVPELVDLAGEAGLTPARVLAHDPPVVSFTKSADEGLRDSIGLTAGLDFSPEAMRRGAAALKDRLARPLTVSATKKTVPLREGAQQLSPELDQYATQLVDHLDERAQRDVATIFGWVQQHWQRETGKGDENLLRLWRTLLRAIPELKVIEVGFGGYETAQRIYNSAEGPLNGFQVGTYDDLVRRKAEALATPARTKQLVREALGRLGVDADPKAISKVLTKATDKQSISRRLALVASRFDVDVDELTRHFDDVSLERGDSFARTEAHAKRLVGVGNPLEDDPTTVLPYLYGSVTEGQPGGMKQGGTIRAIYPESVRRLTTVHHDYMLGAPEVEDIHAATAPSLRGLWGAASLTPSAPPIELVGNTGRTVTSSSLLVGPLAEDAARAAMLIMSAPDKVLKLAAAGQTDEAAALLLRGTRANQSQGMAENLAIQTSPFRTETLVIDRGLQHAKAMVVTGQTDEIIAQNAELARRLLDQAGNTKAPVYAMRAPGPDAVEKGIASAVAPPTIMPPELSPGRAAFVDQYTRLEVPTAVDGVKGAPLRPIQDLGAGLLPGAVTNAMQHLANSPWAAVVQHAWDLGRQAQGEANQLTLQGQLGLRFRDVLAIWRRQVVEHPKNIFQDEGWGQTVLRLLQPGAAQTLLPRLRAEAAQRLGAATPWEREPAMVRDALTSVGRAGYVPRLGDSLQQAERKLARYSSAQTAVGEGLLSALNPAAFATNVLGVGLGTTKGALAAFRGGLFEGVNGFQQASFRRAAFMDELTFNLEAAAAQFLPELQRRGVDVSRLSPSGGFSPGDVAAVGGRQLGEAWRATVDQAIALAEGRAKFLFGDYSQPNVFERLVGGSIPFASWVTRAYPVALAMALEHPLMVLALATTLAEASAGAGENGRPGYTAGMIPVPTKTPLVGPLLALLTGGEGVGYIDPAGAISPVGLDLFAPEDDPNATWYDRAVGMAGRVGIPAPNPAIGAAAYVTGLSSRSPNALSRTAGIENALALVPGNPALPNVLPRALAAVRANLSPVVADAGLGGRADPSPSTYDPVTRRYAELVLRDTGKPLSDRTNLPYVYGMSDPTNDLLQEARVDVLLGAGLKNAVSLTSPVAVVTQTSQNQDYRAARAAQPYTYDQIAAAPSQAQRKRLQAANDAYTQANPANATYSGADPEGRTRLLLADWERRNGALKIISPTQYERLRREFLQSLGLP